MTTVDSYHVPVLLNESIDGLAIQPNGVYVDVTFGGGGHSSAILDRLSGEGHLYSFDQDADAEQNVKGLDSSKTGSFTFVRSNFRYIRQWMRYYGIDAVDGVLADLGVSSHHFDDCKRGFSFRYDNAPLDMRMNNRASTTAADVLNTYSEEQLADVFFLYGELRQARHLASAIAKARTKERISTTGQLLGVLGIDINNGQSKKDMARLFQALRIEVNNEMTALAEMLCGARDVLKSGGRLAVITYHSLEDRLVKNVMKTGNIEGRAVQDFFGRSDSPFRQVSKVITPGNEEQQRNPRSRSAKLRIAEKI